jgi:hypothetical protein
VGLFTSKQESNLKVTIRLVEEVITELGLKPEENRLQVPGGGLAWGLMKGSAEVFIFLVEGDPGAYHSLQVVAPVMKMPDSPVSQMALFRRLLELNAQVISGAGFGIKEDTVMLISDRSTEDLNTSEVREMVLRVGHFADLYDDELVNQFGGARHSE